MLLFGPKSVLALEGEFRVGRIHKERLGDGFYFHDIAEGGRGMNLQPLLEWTVKAKPFVVGRYLRGVSFIDSFFQLKTYH
jgi:hypothetical protein